MNTHLQKETLDINFSDLNINIAQVEKIMGYKEGESQEAISEMIMSVLKVAESMCRIKAEYAVYPIERADDIEKTLEINNLYSMLRR